MKTKIITLIAIFFSIAVFSQTIIPAGPISGTWTSDGSPYLVQGKTTIADGATLTIEAGVRVELPESSSMFVYGQILALGTETDSIIFTASADSSWFRGIRFEYTSASNDTSYFNYCVFRYGKVYGDEPDCSGGAIASLFFSKLVIDHCLFDNNEAIDISIYPNPAGGAIGLWSSSPVIRNSKFTNNTSFAAGAIFCYEGSHPVIENNEFYHNTAIGTDWGQGYGGAISCYINCHPQISKNIYINNLAHNGGGAIALVESCNPMIINNLFDKNTSYWLAGAIEIQDFCSPQIINNTIVNNQSDFGGGIDVWTAGHPQIRNTILWGNTATEGEQVYIWETNSIVDFYCSDLQGGQEAIGGVPHIGEYENCIEDEPIFVGTGDFPYQINDDSPCIDAGDPDTTGLNLPDFDLAGEPRVFNEIVDIGAYEWNPLVGTDEYGIKKLKTGIHCYPNPISNSTTIEYELDQITDVELSIYNHHGGLIEVIQERKLSGEHQVVLNMVGLPSGVYYCVLKTNWGTLI